MSEINTQQSETPQVREHPPEHKSHEQLQDAGWTETDAAWWAEPEAVTAGEVPKDTLKRITRRVMERMPDAEESFDKMREARGLTGALDRSASTVRKAEAHDEATDLARTYVEEFVSGKTSATTLRQAVQKCVIDTRRVLIRGVYDAASHESAYHNGLAQAYRKMKDLRDLIDSSILNREEPDEK